eukprot:Opistho-1_new@65289
MCNSSASAWCAATSTSVLFLGGGLQIRATRHNRRLFWRSFEHGVHRSLAARRRYGLQRGNRQRPPAVDGRGARRRRTQPGAAPDGDRAGRDWRVRRLRRGADPAARATRHPGLRSEAERRAGNGRSEGVHEDSPAVRRSRPWLAPGGGGARRGAVARKILLGERDAGQDRRHDDRRGDRRGLVRRTAGPHQPVIQMRWAVVVMTLAMPRINHRTGAGSDVAPACSAAAAGRASCARLWAAIGREETAAAGKLARCGSRCCSTWRSVSTTKPRLAASPMRAAINPRLKEPAYHSGLSQLVRPFNSANRASVQARWSASSRAA